MEMKSFVRANLDRVVAVAMAVIGVLAIVIGWIGISGTGIAAEQIPYLISGGIGGLVLVALGCTAWISADLQDEWRRLDDIEERLQALGQVEPSEPSETSGDDSAARNGGSPRRTRPLVPTDAPR